MGEEVEGLRVVCPGAGGVGGGGGDCAGEEGGEFEDVGDAVHVSGEQHCFFPAVEDGIFGVGLAVFCGEGDSCLVEGGNGIVEGAGTGCEVGD